jgi:NADPH:quinone reductase-like Zn-dependent oxidoreductase
MNGKDASMRAITVRDRDAGVGGLTLTDMPYPHAAENDVIVRVHAAGFTPGELAWPATWSDRAGRDRTPSIPGHELSGVVAELGYGTTGLTVGQRVFGLTDWARNGSLAEYAAVEARNLAPLAADIDHTVAAALPISGLTAWQALFDHAHLTTGQTVLIHGAAGGVGSLAVQLAREVGAHVVGTGRSDDREVVLGLGAQAFLDLDADDLRLAGEVDVVLDVIGGDVLKRSTELVRPGGTLVTIAMPPTTRPKDGRADLLRRRTRPRPAGRPRPAPSRRPAQPPRQRRPTAFRSGVRVRPPPSHARQDDHPGRGRTRSPALVSGGASDPAAV